MIEYVETLEENTEKKDCFVGKRGVYFRGVYYPSIAACCKALNIKYHRTMGRIWSEKYDTLEDVFFGGCITFQGTEYPSIAACARAHGKNPTLICTRIRSGWTVEEAMTLEKREKKREYYPGKPVYCDGVWYPTIKAFTEKYQLPLSKTSELLKKGVLPKQIIAYYKKKKQPLIYEGKPYPTYKAICEEFGISYPCFINYKHYFQDKDLAFWVDHFRKTQHTK